MRHLFFALAFLTLAQASVKAPQPAPLTELESLRAQNLTLERVIVDRAVNDYRQHALALKADLERARPGWIWNPDDQTWAAKPSEVKK